MPSSFRWALFEGSWLSLSPLPLWPSARLSVCLSICLKTPGSHLHKVTVSFPSYPLWHVMWTEGLACLSLYDRKEAGGTIMAGGLMPRCSPGTGLVGVMFLGRGRRECKSLGLTVNLTPPSPDQRDDNGPKHSALLQTWPSLLLLQDTPEL